MRTVAKVTPAAQAILSIVFATGMFSPSLSAQSGCQIPSDLLQPAGHNIFAEPQEVDLRDALAEHVRQNMPILDDPEAIAYIQKIGDRLTRQLPPSHLHFQYHLVDLPYAQAFSLPGGRIYIRCY
jgi:predicted Zn-dependent protease